MEITSQNELAGCRPVIELAINGNYCYCHSMSRREYAINITVNEILITKVIIDSHYEEKHSESISDEIIVNLVNTLDGQNYEPDDEKPPYSYFVTDNILLNDKTYKLIWLLEDHEIYIGVINAHRR